MYNNLKKTTIVNATFTLGAGAEPGDRARSRNRPKRTGFASLVCSDRVRDTVLKLQNNLLDVMIGYLDGGCVYPPRVVVVCAASSWTRSSCPPPGPRGATCLV